MIRRIIPRVVALLLVILSILTGCNKTTYLEDDLALEIEELDPVTLDFFMLGDEKEDTKEVLDKVAEETGLNIKLNFEWINYDQYTESVKTALASNQDIDAFLCGSPNSWLLNFVDMYREGQIKDITELLPEYAPVIQGRLTTEEQNAAKVDGKLVAVPSLYPHAKCFIAIVKENYAEKYNISSIDTLDDYEDLLKRIKDNEKNTTPCFTRYDIDLFANTFDYVVLDHRQHLVYKWDDPEMRIVPWEQTAAFKETASLIIEWHKNGYISTDASRYADCPTLLEYRDQIPEGKTTFYFSDGSGDIKKEDCFVYNLYKDKKFQRKSPIENYVSAFNSKSNDTERALMFLNWIQRDQENYDLFMHGIKNRHYVLKGERIDKPDEIKAEGENPYSGWQNSAFYNIKFFRLPVENDTFSDDYFNDYLDFINNHTSYAPHEGFYADYKDLQSEYSARKNFYNIRIAGPLSDGTFNTANIDNVISLLKAAGTNNLVSNVQDQLDKWRLNNNK